MQSTTGGGTTEALLANVALFEGLSEKQLQKVADLATRIDGPAGTVLTEEGDIGLELVVVLAGEVEIRRCDEVIATRGAGDCIGEIALVEHRPRTATVVATTPVIVEVIDARAFNTLARAFPTVVGRIRSLAQERLVETGTAVP